MENTDIEKIGLAAPYFHPHVGGVESHVYELAKHLSTRGYTVEVLTSNSENVDTEEIVQNVVSELLRRYNIDDVDSIQNLLPEKYRGIFKMFKSVPWNHTVDIISMALKETGKTENGGYETTEKVLQKYIGKFIGSKIKSAVRSW